MIELSTVLQELRAELAAAMADAESASEAIRFGLGPVEVEFTMAMSREGRGSGKVKFYVLELGGDLMENETTTQRIKLTLEPSLVDAAGRPTRKPYISGDAEPNER